MFAWGNRMEDLLGFNPLTFLIISSIVTGLGFPFIFLNTDWNDFLNVGLISVPFGMLYASILTFGNTYIYYLGRTKEISYGGVTRRQRLYRLIFIHLLFTVVVSSLLGYVGSLGLEGKISFVYILRNVVGSVLLSSLILILFESFHNMHKLSQAEKREAQLKQQNVESQMEILKNQVKPHFLFNSLNTVISIIPDEPDKAIDYVQRLSKVYRYILEIKDKKLIPIYEELDCIKDYAYMLKIRFGNNLQFDIDEKSIDVNQHIVPLSVQLLVENAVKHNIISNKRPLKITIHKGQNGSLLVSNNLQPKVQKMPSTGTGLVNIRERYHLLTDHQVDIIQTQNTFTVSIPLIEIA
jgi:sensor histidine kinase YesM